MRITARSGRTLVNGKALAEGEAKQVAHKDRILIGNHNLFVYCDPSELDKTMPDWEEAMKEASKDSALQQQAIPAEDTVCV